MGAVKPLHVIPFWNPQDQRSTMKLFLGPFEAIRMNRKVKNVQTLKLYIFFGYINGGFDITTLYGIAFWNSWNHGSTYTVFFKIVESVRINNEARIVQNLVILIIVSMLMEF